MPDVHLPHLEDEGENTAGPSPEPDAARSRQPAGRATRRSSSLLKIGLEVLLISAGVFLGLMGEQWREHARHRELAEESVRRFRTEVQTNRRAVADVEAYHAATLKSVQAYFAADPEARHTVHVDIQGIRPASFAHTAWDLALATQSLVYIDPQLAFGLARIYNVQQRYEDFSREIMQTTYLRPPSENLDAFLRSLEVYYADIVGMEPALLTQYDDILPQIDRALGESAAQKTSAK